MKYIPPKDGEYVITVTFAGVPVPKSPFTIKVSPGCDASKCKVGGAGMCVTMTDLKIVFFVGGGTFKMFSGINEFDQDKYFLTFMLWFN